MSQKTIAEILVETLVAAGVKRIFGVVGDSLNGILEEIEVSGYDGRFSPQWLHVLSRVVAPLRYPGHGLQMVALISDKWLRADALSSRGPASGGRNASRATNRLPCAANSKALS